MKGVAKGRQLGSPERIREKIEVKTALLVSSELAGEREKAESKITELEEKVESAETRARAAAARAVRAEIRCDRIPDLEQQLQSTQQLLQSREDELKALTAHHRATRDTLLHTQEQFSTQQQAHSHLQYTAQQTQEKLLARVQSTEQLLHTKEEELKALTTQYRATCDTLLHTQEQFSTQQQAHSHLQYTAQQKEEQLQGSVRENAVLYTHSQALENQVVTLQSKIAQLEQTLQATQAALDQIPYLEQQLQSKQAQLQSLTEVPVQPMVASVCQAGLQTGAIGTLHPAELQIQHAELQQRVTYLEEELAKEAFLANARGYEVDALQDDVMDRQQIQFHNTSTQTVVDDICIPGTSLTGEKATALFLAY